MSGGTTRGATAIVGVAESDLGQVAEGVTPQDLMAQGIVRALDDAGLTLADVDGLFLAASQLRMPTISMCEYLGIAPRYMDSSFTGGSSFEALAAHAALALEAGPAMWR